MKTCPKCKKELKDTAKFCSGCGYQFPMEAAAPQQQEGIVCPKCGNLLKPAAKFCGKCGTKIEQNQSAAAAPSGNSPAPAAADNAFAAATPQKDYSLIGSFLHWNILPGQIAVKIDENDIAAFGKCVKGVNIQAGVKALFLVEGKVVAQLEAGNYPFKNFGVGDFKPASIVNAKEEEILVSCPQCGAEFKPNVKFCSKCGARLPASSVDAKAMEKAEQKKGFLGNLFGAIGGAVANVWNRITGREAQQRAENAGLTTRIPASIPPVSFILIRDTEFPLVFAFKNANTANVRSDVGLHLLCKINNINEFYANMLLDRKMVCFENLSQILSPLFENDVNLALSGISPEAVANNAALQGEVLAKLQAVMPGVYPFISVSRILKLTAAHEDLDNLRQLSEELYVSEQELNQAMRRNEFLNRLQAVRNEQELAELNAANSQHNAIADIQANQGLTDLRRTTSTDVAQNRINSQFEAEKEKIYEEMALTQDERARFDMMLRAQRLLREAKSEEEVAVAMHAYEQSGLLRKQEMDNLRRQITQDARIKELDDAQLLAVTTMNNEHTLEQQKFEWEIQMGTRKLEEELKLRRMREAYQDELRDKEDAHSDRRRDADAQFEDSRRQSQINLNREERHSNIELDHEEQQNQMDALRQAQALRMEREEAEHKRDMEAAAAARQFNLDDKKLDMAAEQARLDAEALKQKQQLDAQINTTQIYAGMTVEQIMAANPNLTEHAAKALAAKYNSEHAVEAANAKAQAAIEMQNQMNSFMQQQMQNKDQDTQSMRDMMMQMMQMNNQQNQTQMQMMRDMGVAQSGNAQAFQQQLLDAKQQELDHTRADAAANSDRFVDGMKTTINAVGNMNPTQFIPVQPVNAVPVQQVAMGAPALQSPVPAAPPQAKAAAHVCPHCGAAIEEGAMFCAECGKSL